MSRFVNIYLDFIEQYRTSALRPADFILFEETPPSLRRGFFKTLFGRGLKPLSMEQPGNVVPSLLVQHFHVWIHVEFIVALQSH